jgi:archaellum component FlaC
MPREEFPISTGVDGLLKLVREKGRIGLTEAAIELGTSQGIIEEWATVLEKEGVIKMDYQFTKIYLNWSDKSRREVERRIEDVAQKQIVLGRETESQLKRVEKIGSKLSELRDRFMKISDVYESKISGIRQRIEELTNLEKQFGEILFRGTEISKNFDNELNSITAKIDGDEKKLQEIKKMKEELEKCLKEIKPEVDKLREIKGGGK